MLLPTRNFYKILSASLFFFFNFLSGSQLLFTFVGSRRCLGKESAHFNFIIFEKKGFFSPESTLCALIRCPFHPCFTVVARKRPRSFCQKCRWQIKPKQAYTLDPTKSEWADYAAVREKFGDVSGNELTRNLSGHIWPQSSQLAQPLWMMPGSVYSGSAS